MPMKEKLIAVALVAVMVLSGCMVYTNDAFTQPMTWDTLYDMDSVSAAAVREYSVSGNDITGNDAAAFIMLNSGLTIEQTGKLPSDWGQMAAYIGLDDGIDKKLTSTFSIGDFNRMNDNSEQLRGTIKNGTVVRPLFHDGRSAPIFPFTAAEDSDYSNEDSSIIRYCVYVETDYDTDGDGDRDLIRVFLSVPRAALVNGTYKAPVIFIADGYDMGEVKVLPETTSTSFDMDSLYSQPDERIPEGTMGAWDLAKDSSFDEWGAEKKYGTKTYGRYSYDDYNYYLVRGYAVAISSGLGTYGSEGFQLTGHDLELKAYEKVIEWFDGEATAYTDRENNITTDASWCSGAVGMCGLSYVGTVPLGLSMRNIDNLKTVISFGAIADWYEYAYRQGMPINISDSYMWYMTSGNSSIFYDTERWDEISEVYMEYLGTMSDGEKKLYGSYDCYDYVYYSDHWSKRNYTEDAVKGDTSVMLIHGMFDFNVKSKETDIAYNTLSSLGMTVKVILNQAEHDTFGIGKSDMYVNGKPGYELMNEWYTHYLYGVDNGIENMANITVQSNVDGSWIEYDDLKGNSSITIRSADSGYKTISDDKTIGDDYYSLSKTVDSDTLLYGKGVLKIKVKTNDPEEIYNGLEVALYDRYSEFQSYTDSSGKNFGTTEDDSKVWVGADTHVSCTHYNMNAVDSCLITIGHVNLHYPGSDYRSESVTDFNDLSDGEFMEYTIYLDPTVYTLKEGHELYVSIWTEVYTKGHTVSDIIDLGSIEFTFDVLEQQ